MQCLICNKISKGTLVSSTVRDDETETIKVLNCPHCGHTQLSVLPSQKDEQDFYDLDKQATALWGNTFDIDSIRKRALPDTFRRMSMVKKELKNFYPGVPYASLTALDVGCGYGFFVEELSCEGVFAVGLDRSDKRVAYAQSKGNLSFYKGTLDDFIADDIKISFHIVSAFHVLEHVKDPLDFLKKGLHLVKEGGLFLLEVPNRDDHFLKENEAYNHFYWQKAHLSYFNKKSLEYLCHLAGIKNYRVKCVQRYGISNLENWKANNKPQEGMPSYAFQDEGLKELEKNYFLPKIKKFEADTLLLCIPKTGNLIESVFPT